MKTIKLASGFAVSALALAIAGQATAQTQSSVSFTADVKVMHVIDFQDGQYTNQMPGYVEGNDDWYNFIAAWSVTNGPFSGRLRIGNLEDERTGRETDSGAGRSNAQVIVDSLTVTEGPVMFGQLGRVTATAALYESLTDINQAFSKDEATRLGVNLGLRYTVSEAGLALQLEAPDRENTFGIAGAINQDLDVAKVWLDGQYHAITDAGRNGMNTTNGVSYNVGTAVQADLADPVTVTGVFRSYSKENANPQTVLAAQIEIAASEELSLRGLITDRNFSSDKDKSAVARVGATVSLAPFTVMADYEALTSNISDAFYDARVTWADGPLTAFARLRYAQNGFVGAATNAALLTTGASFTSASGVVYGAEHNLTEKGYLGAASGNELELYASYSF